MLAYVAESAASAPPPRKGPPLIPLGRSSLVPGGTARGAGQLAPGIGDAGDADEAIGAISGDTSADPADGPSLEDLEAQMGGEVAARDAATTRRPERPRPAVSEDDDEAQSGGKGAPLPELDELLARLPAEVREATEELLRVRFVAVKKVPKQALSGDDARGAGSGLKSWRKSRSGVQLAKAVHLRLPWGAGL